MAIGYKHVEIIVDIDTFINDLKVKVYKFEDKLVIMKSFAHNPSSSSMEIVSMIKMFNLNPFNRSKNARVKKTSCETWNIISTLSTFSSMKEWPLKACASIVIQSYDRGLVVRW